MLYDVTVPITNSMPVWPSDPPVRLTPQEHPGAGKSHRVRVTGIEMGSHTGTHIDAPWHFLDSGRRLNQIPLDILVGPVSVVEISGVPSILPGDIAPLSLQGIQRIFFKTENSKHWNEAFQRDFVYLEPEAAQMLADCGIKLVGIDYLSIDKFSSEKHPTHITLLERNVVIMEGLNLSSVSPGTYQMTALPLNLQDADGAPTRVILADL